MDKARPEAQAVAGVLGDRIVAGGSAPVFRHVSVPNANALQRLVEQIAAQVGQVLERRGLI